MVLFPATEHAPFDLVTYDEDIGFQRVQVKFRSARSGALTVNCRSVWADGNGTRMRPTAEASIDLLCISCPETDHCYYLRPIEYGKSVTLRIVEARNRQVRNVILADQLRCARVLTRVTEAQEAERVVVMPAVWPPPTPPT